MTTHKILLSALLLLISLSAFGQKLGDLTSTNAITATNTLPITIGTNTFKVSVATLLSGVQPTNANLTVLATTPTTYQATNSNLTVLANTPTTYQATNVNLTAVGTNTFTGTGPIVERDAPELVTPKSSGLILTGVDMGTVANGGTVTLPLTTNVMRVISSGATFTVALPSISITTNIYQLRLNVTNTSGGTQIGSFSPALMRQEIRLPVTTITNLSGADASYTFESQAGAWHYVGAVGDALSIDIPVPSTGFRVGDGVNVPSTGKVLGFWTSKNPATIAGWAITVDTGTCTVKTWKIATGTAHPTIANVISTSGVSLSSGTMIQSTDLSDFGSNTNVAAGDTFAFDLTAVSGSKDITFQLQLIK